MLWYLWRRLLGLCDHEYEIIDTVKMVAEGHELPYATKYVQRCEKCGMIRSDTV